MNKKKVITKEEKQYLEKLGTRIRTLRIEKGFTNYEHFAYDNFISRSQFGKYERGSNIEFITLLKIIKGLGITVESFFSEGFDEPVKEKTSSKIQNKPEKQRKKK